ncbi:hypothetical protein pb186bvf_010984 [Paramecium bursaria]
MVLERLSYFNDFLVFGNVLFNMLIKQYPLYQMIVAIVLIVLLLIIKMWVGVKQSKYNIHVQICCQISMFVIYFFASQVEVYNYTILAMAFSSFIRNVIKIEAITYCLIFYTFLGQFSPDGLRRNIYELPIVIISFGNLCLMARQYFGRNQLPKSKSESYPPTQADKLMAKQYILFIRSYWLRAENGFILNQDLQTQQVFGGPPTPYFTNIKSSQRMDEFFQDNFGNEKTLKYHLTSLLEQIRNQTLQIAFHHYFNESTHTYIIIDDQYEEIQFVAFFKNRKIEKDSTLQNVCQSISHELSTCLNCILTLSQLFNQNDDVPKDFREQYVEPVLMNSRQLELIISNLKDYNTLTTNNFMSQISKFNLFQEITEIVEYFQSTLNQKQIDMEYEYSLSDSFVIDGDKLRIRQVFYQIMSNAVRFSQKGAIKIILKKDGFDSITVTVSDQGIGMKQDEILRLKEILNKFQPQKVSLNSIGCGLGLYISNLIMKQLNHQRQIEFHSQYKQGSTFSFQLRCDKSDSVIASKGHSERLKFCGSNSYKDNLFEMHSPTINQMSSQGQIRKGKFLTIQSILISKQRYDDPSLSFKNEDSSFLNLQDDDAYQIMQPPELKTQSKFSSNQGLTKQCCKRILIVDDEYFNIFALQMVIQSIGGQTESAFNGQQALQKIHNKEKCKICGCRDYLLIFLDINMPIMDGIHAVKEIKSLVNNSIIESNICIANTAYSDIQTKQLAFDAGMDYYFTKPIDVLLLKQLMGRLSTDI